MALRSARASALRSRHYSSPPVILPALSSASVSASAWAPLSELPFDFLWHPSPISRQIDSSESLLLRPDGRLRGATPPKLVEKLLDESVFSHSDVVSFLLVFEAFLSPAELLDLLCGLYESSSLSSVSDGGSGPLKPEQLRVATVLCKWLELCPQHFLRESLLPARLLGWTHRVWGPSHPQLLVKLLRAARAVWQPPTIVETKINDNLKPESEAEELDEKAKLRAAVRARLQAHAVLGGESNSLTSSSSLPTSHAGSSGAVRGSRIVTGSEGLSTRDSISIGEKSGEKEKEEEDALLPWGWGGPTGAGDLFEVKADEIARQLTLMDYGLFVRLPLNELHGRGWLENGGALCPRLMAGIAQFNGISRALATAVLACPRAEERATQLAWWLRVAHQCRAIGNFSSTIALMAALASSPIHRLRKSWALLRRLYPSAAALQPALEALAASASNWAGLRAALRSSQPPVVPYMGLYCSDLTFVDQGNPSRLPPHNLVNWDKARLEAGIIREVNLYQLSPYRFQPVPLLQELIVTLDQLDDEALYSLSLKWEPRTKS